jgi:hypothetical protein
LFLSSVQLLLLARSFADRMARRSVVASSKSQYHCSPALVAVTLSIFSVSRSRSERQLPRLFPPDASYAASFFLFLYVRQKHGAHKGSTAGEGSAPPSLKRSRHGLCDADWDHADAVGRRRKTPAASASWAVGNQESRSGPGVGAPPWRRKIRSTQKSMEETLTGMGF